MSVTLRMRMWGIGGMTVIGLGYRLDGNRIDREVNFGSFARPLCTVSSNLVFKSHLFGICPLDMVFQVQKKDAYVPYLKLSNSVVLSMAARTVIFSIIVGSRTLPTLACSSDPSSRHSPRRFIVLTRDATFRVTRAFNPIEKGLADPHPSGT